MDKKYIELLWSLKQRLDYCLDEYIGGILAMDKQDIIIASSDIIAVKETHYELTYWLMFSAGNTKWLDGMVKSPIDEQEVLNLLSLENPLKELADKWWFYTAGNKVDFYKFYVTEISATRNTNEGEVSYV